MKILTGGRDDLFKRPGCAAQRLAWTTIRDYDPEILVITPCSSRPGALLRELHYWLNKTGGGSQAVRRRAVYVIDHNYFSRPGPRIVMGLEILGPDCHAGPFRDMIPAATALKLELPPGCTSRRQRLPGTFGRIRWWSAYESHRHRWRRQRRGENDGFRRYHGGLHRAGLQGPTVQGRSGLYRSLLP